MAALAHVYVEMRLPLDQFAAIGIDIDALATNLQDEGAVSFVNSWNDLMNVIKTKSAALQTAS